MAEVRIVGHGLCPKCGKQTDIVEVRSFLFPEEEQLETTEKCPSCGFEIEKGFCSSNAQTSFEHSTKREMIMGPIGQRVAGAIQGISGLISSYTEIFTRPDIMGVTSVLEPLQIGDFPFLYVELAKLANSPLGEVRFNSLAEIMHAAKIDREFAHNAGRPMSEGMTEYNDNEARVEARGSAEEEKVINSIIMLVKIVEQNKKNS